MSVHLQGFVAFVCTDPGISGEPSFQVRAGEMKAKEREERRMVWGGERRRRGGEGGQIDARENRGSK